MRHTRHRAAGVRTANCQPMDVGRFADNRVRPELLVLERESERAHWHTFAEGKHVASGFDVDAHRCRLQFLLPP